MSVNCISNYLKVGKKIVVTVENIINDCVVVTLIVGSQKFAGALLDISKKNIPHGICTVEESKEDSTESRDVTQPKLSHKTPFPQPLLTRSSYKQNVPQPPLRNIFRRIRRSRRNTRLNMVPHLNGDLLKLRHTKSVANNIKQQQNNSNISKLSNTTSKSTKLSSKRKIDSDIILATKKKKSVASIDSQSISDEDNKQDACKAFAPEKLASPLKNLIPRKADLCEPKLHRSPAITIKYKSPAGRGRVINIPSKVHSPLAPDFNFSGNSKDSLVSTVTKLKKTPRKSAVPVKSSLKKKKESSSQLMNKKSMPCTKTKANLRLLKEITDVEVRHFSKKEDSREKSNNFMVVVNKDSKSDKETTISKSNEYPVKQLKKATKNVKKEHNDVKVTDLSSPIAAVKSRHLRVVLKPLVKSGMENEKSLNSKDIPKGNDIPSTSKNLSDIFSTNTRKTPPKRSLGPCSHTIYVTTCKDINGIIFTQGDIVWGKLSGYPWWPSRIIKLIITKTDGKVLQQEAMVGWLRSSTTSIIPLDSVQPFDKKFDIRFEKKRKGVYQRAVNDAKAAIKEISPEVRKLISQFET